MDIKKELQAFRTVAISNADKYSKESFKVKDRYDRSDNKAQAAMHMGASSSSDVNLFVATGHQEKNLIGASQ